MGETIYQGEELGLPLKQAMTKCIVAWWLKEHGSSGDLPDVCFVVVQPDIGLSPFAQRLKIDETITFHNCHVDFSAETLYAIDSEIREAIRDHRARLEEGRETAALIDEWSQS